MILEIFEGDLSGDLVAEVPQALADLGRGQGAMPPRCHYPSWLPYCYMRLGCSSRDNLAPPITV